MQSVLANSETGSLERHVASNPPNRPVLLRVRSLTVLALCILAFGCQEAATTWSAEALSPDGQWLAIARTQQWGGPGTAYDATTVSLKQVNAAPKDPTQVLLFSHQYSTMSLKMDWITPTHLQVTYASSSRPGDHVSLDFQVAKMNGIDISARVVTPTMR
jgi:hypothetical protein